MKKLLIIISFFICLNSFATNYYFSNSGNDITGTGAIGAPWQTIAKFNSVFASKAPGDFFLFNRGDIFYGKMIISRSGSSGSPMTIGAYGSGAKPIITGFTTASAWSNLGGNIWETTSAISALPYANMVTVNGIIYAMGRSPNSGFYIYQSHIGNPPTSLTSSNLNSSVTNWTGAEVAFQLVTYITGRNPITAHSGSTISLGAVPSEVGIQYDNAPFIIQNDARTLDVQNEWYYSPSTKKLRIYSTSSPTGVQIATIDTLVYNNGYDYITFDNIYFQGSNKYSIIVANSATNNTIQNCDFNFSGRDGIFVYGGINTAIKIESCTFNNTNNNAINGYYTAAIPNAIIRLNSVKNSGKIFGAGANLYTGVGGTYQSGIIAKGLSSLIELNTVDSSGYDGIEFYSSNSIIQKNYVTNFCLILHDGGGIYTYNSNTSPAATTNIKILNNIILNSTNDYGIYLDDGSNGIEISGNTIANCTQGIFNHNNFNLDVHGNTIYNNGQGLNMSFANTSVTPSSLKYHNNIYFAKTALQLCSYMDDLERTLPVMTSDTNYFARPIAQTQIINYIQRNPYAGTIGNLAQWQTYSSGKGFSQDAHSFISPVTVSNVNQIDFRFNATASPVVETLFSGTWKDVKNVSYSGTTTLQPYTSLVLMNTGGVGNILPTANAGSDQTITWPTNSVSLSGSGSDADGSISAYNWTKISGPASGTITNPNSASTTVTGLAVGVYQFQLQVTDNSGGTATDVVQITVNKGTATISVSGTTVTFNNSPQGVTVTTSPAGLSTSTTYNGISTKPTNAGSYTSVTGGTDPNYNFNTVTVTFTINKQTIVINAADKTVFFDGNPQSITATTTPFVSGLVLDYLYNDNPVQPSAIGSYDVAISTSDVNHQATIVHVTLNIVSNPSIISISGTAKIYNSSPQGVTVTSAYSYAVTYNGSATVPTLAGSYTAIATVNDGIHTGADTAVLVIAKQPAVLSWGAIAPMPYGSQLTPTQLNAGANISGTWSYTKNLGDILPIGTTSITGTFTPTDGSNYSGGTVTQTINVYGVNPFLDYFISGNGKFFFIEQ